MQKRMLAKYHGRDAHTGAAIRPGDEIIYCTATRTAWHTDEDFDYTPPTTVRPYQSDVLLIGGVEYFRNKAGRCIDAPCCGCCTI
jgi:hypothetical protein